MSIYSVADAKNGLARLIDRALEGEQVIISRHGKAVAELRPIVLIAQKAPATYGWLQARRRGRKPSGLTSVELLNQLDDDPEG